MPNFFFALFSSNPPSGKTIISKLVRTLETSSLIENHRHYSILRRFHSNPCPNFPVKSPPSDRSTVSTLRTHRHSTIRPFIRRVSLDFIDRPRRRLSLKYPCRELNFSLPTTLSLTL